MYNRYTFKIGIQPLNNRYITVLNLRGGFKQYPFIVFLTYRKSFYFDFHISVFEL